MSADPMARQRYFADAHNRGVWPCADCKTERPLAEFHIRKSGRGIGKPTAPRCKVHQNAALRHYRIEWQYGLTPPQYDEMLRSQGGTCALCDRPEPGGKGAFHVDHDHACCPGKKTCGECVRGLLCTKCNAAIGFFEDNPELMRKAINYVSR